MRSGCRILSVLQVLRSYGLTVCLGRAFVTYCVLMSPGCCLRAVITVRAGVICACGGIVVRNDVAACAVVIVCRCRCACQCRCVCRYDLPLCVPVLLCVPAASFCGCHCGPDAPFALTTFSWSTASQAICHNVITYCMHAIAINWQLLQQPALTGSGWFKTISHNVES